jgi:DNA polymerase-3 subunit alpha
MAETGAPAEKKPGMDFAHLHLHTTYSLLDGAIRIPDLMKYCKENGMTSVAMTDHGNMFGAIQFYKEAVKQGIKPIIGNEFYISPGGRFEKRDMEKLADGNNYHLILLAQNNTGYQNLIKLTSRSYTEGFYRKPRIDYELLEQHSEGVVCLTACLGGEVQNKILHGKEQEAAALAGKLSEIFGKDRFFLEIQNHGMPEERTAALGNIEIAKRHGIKLALTNDSHFLRREDHVAQDILLRINQKKTVEDPTSFSFTPDFHVKTPQEMFQLFPEHPEAFYNTLEIAGMVDLNFKFGNPLLPRFEVPEGYTLDSYMHHLAFEGLKVRYGTITPQVQERFDFEFSVIQKMDFAGYFLIVQDFINYAKRSNIPVGPGRGSAAGSIISYALGITDLDPIRYGLLFERFLNPDRKEMPDIDVDFCVERREEVIAYVRQKYGQDRVGQIITYGTMAAKACLKDVARVLNIPFQESNDISKMFPEVLGITIEEALQQSKELRTYSERGDVQKQLFKVALRLEDNVRHTGVHAAGVVIAPAPLEELVPLATVAAKDESGEAQRVLVTQYDMTALAEVGLVKMDFLGLRNLTVLHKTVEGVEKRTGKRIDLLTLPLDDEKTYRLLQKADLKGVFQLETSPGMRDFCIRIVPKRFEDLIDLIALYRPGPLQSGMAESYIKRRKGQERVTVPHPDLKEVLEDTFGVMIYQEQVMLISRKIGGFTPGESDALRKAMGKKIHEKMQEMKSKFVNGAKQKGHTEAFASDLFDSMAEFASYGFNKSHSAAYALIVYQTAYMKANYPTDTMRSLLESKIGKTEELVPYLNACHEMGIKILGPDVNQSDVNFSYVEEGIIRFGISAIKNVGELAARSIIACRADGPYKNVVDFLERVDLRLCNRRTVEALVLAGAFDTLGYTRKALMGSLDVAYQRAQKNQADRVSGQASLFGAVVEEDDFIPRGDSVQEFDETTLLRNEREMLGCYLTGHPLARFDRMLSKMRIHTVESLQRMNGGDKVELAGVVGDISRRLTKTGKEMWNVRIEDRTGSIEAVLFSSTVESSRQFLNKDVPLLFTGRVEKDDEKPMPRLRVESVREMTEEAMEEKMERSLHVKITTLAPQDAEPVLKQIQTILRCHKGNLRVFFHIPSPQDPNTKKVIRAHDSFCVQMNRTMIEQLKKVTSVQAIYLSVGTTVRPV